MSLTASIAGVLVGVQSISRPDLIDQKTTCSITVVDTAGTAFFKRGQPIAITDSILGTVFTGFIHNPQMTLLYPSVQKSWTMDCIQRGDYLASKRTSNKTYNNQYTGTVVVDQIQRYGSAEGLIANAALRWDELASDWSAGTLSNTTATTNVTDGNPGAGDLELSLAGVDVVASGPGGGFGLGPGLKLVGYASSGYVNAYTYRQIWSGSQLIGTQDDALLYDVWVSSTSPQIKAGVDFICSDGTTLRDSSPQDTQGLSAHPTTDLSGLANDQWYSREVFIPPSLNGKTIVSFSVAFEGDNQGLYTAYFRNIVYYKNTGTIPAPNFVPVNIFTSTLQMNSQIGNNGYSNVSLTQISVQNKSFTSTPVAISIGAAGIVQSSQMSFSSVLPVGGTALAETSIDNGASWQAITSGSAIPNLLPGMSVAGRSIYYRFGMSLGTEPVANVGFGGPAIIVKSAYNTSKSDAINSYTTATDFNGGALTALKTVGATTVQGVTLNGVHRTWDNSDTSGQTFFGNISLLANNILNKQFQLTAPATSEAKNRLDFGLTWHNFTSEVDLTAISTTTSASFVYRTTGWQAVNSTGGYTIDVFTNIINFGYGTNTATGAGAYTALASVATSLTANSMHRLKVVVNGANHQIYLDGVLCINVNDSKYSQYSLTAAANAPLAYYRMDETSGTTLVDSSAHASNGTINASGVTYAQAGAITTDLDTAQKYDGAAGHALMNASVTAAGLSHVSIECWCKLTSNTYTGNPRLVANGHTDTLFTGMQLWINTTGKVMMDVGNGTTHGVATSTSSLVAGTWAYVVGTYDGANVRIYFNGVLQQTTAFTGTIASTTFACGIGYNPVYSGDYFPGTIDEVCVYTSTLSQTQITADYTAATTFLVTSPSAGSIGLRVFNNTAAQVSVLFDNFGVCQSLVGTWQSPSIPLAGASSYGNSIVQWDIDGLPDTTTSITAQTSIDGGATYQAVTNGGQISGLTHGQSLASVNLLIKMTLTASNAPIVPVLNGVTAWIIGAYSATGTRVSPALSLAGVGRALNALVNWNANTPVGTSLAVATSIDNGSTWQSVATPGAAIANISTQPAPVEDTFSANSSANYTQGNFGGTTGAWVWDTANSRLVGSGGTNGTLTALSALTFADSQVSAVLDQADGSGLLANYTVAASGYYIQIWDSAGTGTQNSAMLFKRNASTNVQVGTTVTISFTRGTPHLFTLDVQAGVIVVSMDGASIITYTDGSPLGSGLSGLLLNTLARVYSLRIQQYGQNVSALSLLTKLTLTSTDPTVTPQVLNLQAFVSSPDIGAGILMPSKAYQRTFLDANVVDLNTQSNYWTYFRNDGSVIFQPRKATPAPFVLSSLNSQVIAGQTINDVLVSGAELDNSGDSYRNRQIMKGTIATGAFTEIKVGDGSATSWAVTNPLVAPPASIILNGQSKTFGVKGVDTGKQYYYQIGSTAITQDSSQVVLQGSDSFSITYTGSFSQDVVRDNTSMANTITQSMMATIENSSGGSSSGIVEAVLDLSGTPTTVAAATVQADQLLQRYGNIGRTFKCKTLRSGLTPGMQVSLFVPEFGLNNVQMLLAGVDVTVTQAPGVNGGLLYAWALTLMEGPNLGTWVQLFTNALS